MQNVATGKSEIAALPLAFNSDSSAIIEGSSEFRAYLKDASDKEFSQPVIPRVPKTSDDNKASEVDSNQTTLKSSEENIESDLKQADIKQSANDSSEQQSESAEILQVAEEQNTTNPVPLADVDLSSEMDSAIPSIDLLDLLQQSQTKEIAITLGHNETESVEFKDVQGLVEHLKALTDQGQSTTDAESIATNKVLDQLITTLEELETESDSPISLTELVSQVRTQFKSDTQSGLNPETLSVLNPDSKTENQLEVKSEIRPEFVLEEHTDVVPLAISDKEVELDIELLSLVTAEVEIAEGEVVKGEVIEADIVEANIIQANIIQGNIAKDDTIEENTDLASMLGASTPKSDTEPQQQVTQVAVEDKPIESSGDEGIARLLADSDSAVALDDEIESPDIPKLKGDTPVVEQAVVVQPQDIKQLIALAPEKLDKALENLATRLAQLEPTNTNGSENQASMPNSFKHDFIASLKTSIEEIRTQLKQGKHIELDLKSLVVDNLNRISQEVNPESVGAALSRFSQTLEISTTLVAHASTNLLIGSEATGVTALVDRALTKENHTQSSLLQAKQTQQQVVQFEKAVNFVRSEGQQQLVEKVRWMVNQNNLQADIRLDPPELGAMKVRVSLNGETASVNIAVQSQQAKDLLDTAAPKLRDLLEQQGIQLGQSSVEQEQHQKDKHSAGPGGNNRELVSENELEEGNRVTEQVIVNGRLSGIDYFV